MRGSNSLSQTANAEKLAFCFPCEMWVPMPGDAACVWLSDTHSKSICWSLNLAKMPHYAYWQTLRCYCGSRDAAGRRHQNHDDRLKPQVNVDSFSLEQAV